MLVLCGIVLTLGTAVLVLAPLVGRFGAPLADGPDLVTRLRDLYALRDVVYETLRDLELDFHAGKIGEADYDELSDRYRREALQVVKRIDALESEAPRLRDRAKGRP